MHYISNLSIKYKLVFYNSKVYILFTVPINLPSFQVFIPFYANANYIDQTVGRSKAELRNTWVASNIEAVLPISPFTLYLKKIVSIPREILHLYSKGLRTSIAWRIFYPQMRLITSMTAYKFQGWSPSRFLCFYGLCFCVSFIFMFWYCCPTPWWCP